MRVLITGSNGFIGRNLRLFLAEEDNIELLLYDRDNTLQDLEKMISASDFVVHLAGVNRPQTPDEFFNGNTDLTKSIVDLLNKHQKNIPLLFSSSIQAELDNDYGKSKRLAEDYILQNYKNGIIFRLHNVFGKYCRPNYNSVVATFCNNIANNLEIKIDNPNSEVELVYIDDLCKTIIAVIKGEIKKFKNYNYIEPRKKISVKELAELIKSFKNSLNGIEVPKTGDPFIKKLYSTYISYCPLESLTCNISSNLDERGSFTELIHTSDSGQLSVSTSRPGITRGNHYHHTKIEKFIVISGEAEIRMRKIDEKQITKLLVSSEKIKVVTIPVGYTHNITNVGTGDLVLLIWCNEIFDKSNPDTYYMEV